MTGRRKSANPKHLPSTASTSATSSVVGSWQPMAAAPASASVGLITERIVQLSLTPNEPDISDDEEIADVPLTPAERARNLAIPALGKFTKEARQQVQQAIDLWPLHHSFYLQLGSSYAMEGDSIEAVAHYTACLELLQSSREAIDKNPLHLAFLRRAQVRSRVGDLNGALVDGKLALEAAPSVKGLQEAKKLCAELAVQLSTALKQAKQQQEAAEVYEYGSTQLQELVEDPLEVAAAQVRSWMMVGLDMARAARKKAKVAIEEFEKMVEEMKEVAEAKQRRNANRAVRRAQQAAACQEVVIERTRIPIIVTPETAPLSIDTTAHSQQEDVAAAVDRRSESSNIRLSDGALLVDAVAALRSKQYTTAAELSNALLMQKPEDATGLWVHARSLFELKQYAEAVSDCKALLGLRSSSATAAGESPAVKWTEFDVKLLLSRSLHGLGNLEGAIQELERAEVHTFDAGEKRRAAKYLTEWLMLQEQQSARAASAATASAAKKNDKNAKPSAAKIEVISTSEKANNLNSDTSSSTSSKVSNSSASSMNGEAARGDATNTPGAATSVRTTPPSPVEEESGADPRHMYPPFDLSTFIEGDEDAVAERERGNKLFKEGKYEEALEAYDHATALNPTCPKAYANAAAVFLKKGDWLQVLDYCDIAIGIDAKYVKAYQRRAEAYKQLNNLGAAFDDLQRVTELEPRNRMAQKELEKVMLEMGWNDADL